MLSLQLKNQAMLYLHEVLSRYFSEKIKKRGKAYYNARLVASIHTEGEWIKAFVMGSRNYEVGVILKPESGKIEFHCECPYFETDNCKHLAAFLYKLKDLGYLASGSSGNETKAPPKKNPESDAESRIFNLVSGKQESPRGLAHFEKFLPPEHPQKSGKKQKTTYRISYAINTSGYLTRIHPLKERLLKDGTGSGDITDAKTINYDNIEPVSFQEKMVLDYLTKDYDGCKIVTLDYSGFGAKKNKEKTLLGEVLEFLAHKEVYFSLSYHAYQPVKVLDEPGECRMFITEKDGKVKLKVSIFVVNQEIIDFSSIVPILDNPLWIYFQNKIFKVNNIRYEQLQAYIENGTEVEIPDVHLRYFEKEYLPKLASEMPVTSDKYEVKELNVTPSKKVYLDEEDKSLTLTLKFDYGGYIVDYDELNQRYSVFEDNKIISIRRDRIAEDAADEEISQFKVKRAAPGVYKPRQNPLNFLVENFDALQDAGFEILGQENLDKFKVNTAKPKVSFNVTSGIDWFDVSTDVDFNGTAVPFSELVEAVKKKRKYVTLSDGSTGVLPDYWMKKLQQTMGFGELKSKDNSVRFSKIQARAVDSLLDEAEDVNVDNEFKEQLEKLNSFEKIEPVSVPPEFKGQLRDYQKHGLDWLCFLKEYSFGGVLADDMGLGKTIQTIALLLKVKAETPGSTSLIVAPTSVIFNWIEEINRFAPSLKVLKHTGIERVKEDNSHFGEYDIVMTSYGIILKDAALLKNFRFSYVILDESQKIKNPNSKSGKAVRSLNADHRLCLTGTPLENNLTELWSQMAFLNPGLLGAFNNFRSTFVKTIQKEDDKSTLNVLKKTIYPFVLRRTKEIVESQLPAKNEFTQYCEMDKEQEKVYNLWKDSIRKEIMESIEEKGIKKSGFKVIEGLLRLRQICNHPKLVKEDYKKKSGKFEEFKELLEEVVSEGHKVLVFSQFVKVLEIMQNYLEKSEITYEILTGSTKDRQERVSSFKSNGKVKVFLISLKAGGFGLNLTEADYVFHYDPWWNPAVENQATDRTHRIGQDKNVFVYKFITKNTVEEKILELQKRKQKLVEDIISSDSSVLKNLTKEDVNILFE